MHLILMISQNQRLLRVSYSSDVMICPSGTYDEHHYGDIQVVVGDIRDDYAIKHLVGDRSCGQPRTVLFAHAGANDI